MIPFAEVVAALPDTITSQEWAEMMGLELEEFAAWYEDVIDLIDEDEIYSRPFAYGRLVAEWRGFAHYVLKAIMQGEPHPSHPFLYEQAQGYMLKAEAIELVAKCRGFDLAAEFYPSEKYEVAEIVTILANPDAIAVKLSECAALSESEANA